MTQVTRRLTFEQYLTLEDLPEGRCELVDGELRELPPESRPNVAIANYLFLLLVNAGIPFNLIYPHACEVQVPIIEPDDPANRYPDLVIILEEHLRLTQRRLTITLDMPPLQLVAEVVSPGEKNRVRDYKNKSAQYAFRGIPEYWLIDPEHQSVIVLELKAGKYAEVGTFRGSDQIISPSFRNLTLTAEQIFVAGK